MTEVSIDSEPQAEPVELNTASKALPKDCEVPSVRTKVRKAIEQNRKYTREKCIECSNCKGSNQHSKRNYQGNSEQAPAIKSCSEDRLIEKRCSPTNGRKCSKKTMNDDDDGEFQSDNVHCKVHHIKCYNCGRRKTKQEDKCCGDRDSHSNRCAKERTEEHYFDSRINDVLSNHLQEKSIFTWNDTIPENQTGRAWIRQSSLVLPYEWEDDCEMIDWVIDQYVQEDNSISAYYKGKIILTLKDALGITSVAADSENLPKRFQSHVLDISIPDIPNVLCSESTVTDWQPPEEASDTESPKPPNSSPPTPCDSPPVLPDNVSGSVQSDECQPGQKKKHKIV